MINVADNIKVDAKSSSSFNKGTRQDMNVSSQSRACAWKKRFLITLEGCFYSTLRDIIVTLCFQPTRTDQNSSRSSRSLKGPNCIIWPRELNFNSCSFFKSNIRNRTTTNVSPIQFFRDRETFFENFAMSSKGSTSIFKYFATEWMLEILKVSVPPIRPPFAFIGYCETEYLTLCCHCAFIEPY